MKAPGLQFLERLTARSQIGKYQIGFSVSKTSKLKFSIRNGREGLIDSASIGQNGLLSNSGGKNLTALW